MLDGERLGSGIEQHQNKEFAVVIVVSDFEPCGYPAMKADGKVD